VFNPASGIFTLALLSNHPFCFFPTRLNALIRIFGSPLSPFFFFLTAARVHLPLSHAPPGKFDPTSFFYCLLNPGPCYRRWFLLSSFFSVLRYTKPAPFFSSVTFFSQELSTAGGLLVPFVCAFPLVSSDDFVSFFVQWMVFFLIFLRRPRKVFCFVCPPRPCSTPAPLVASFLPVGPPTASFEPRPTFHDDITNLTLLFPLFCCLARESGVLYRHFPMCYRSVLHWFCFFVIKEARSAENSVRKFLFRLLFSFFKRGTLISPLSKHTI